MMENLGNWLWTSYGVLGYNWLHFMWTKDGYDESRKRFSFKRYTIRTWDNWVWTILFIPIVAIYAEQIFYYFMKAYEKNWEFNDAVYLGGGLLSGFVYYIIKKLLTIAKALKSINKRDNSK